MNGIYLNKTEQKVLEYWIGFEKREGKAPSLYRAAKDLHYEGHAWIRQCLISLVTKGIMESKPGPRGNVYTTLSDEQTNS